MTSIDEKGTNGLSSYSTPGSAKQFPYSFPTTTQLDREVSSSSIMEGETEAWKGKVTC